MKKTLTKTFLLSCSLISIMAAGAVAAEALQPGARTGEQKQKKNARTAPRFLVLPGTRTLVFYAAGGEKYTLRCGTWRRVRRTDDARIESPPTR